MEVLVARRRLGKPGVVVSDKPRQEGVCRIDRADAGKPQLLYQAILERMMSTLDAALRLAGVGTEKIAMLSSDNARPNWVIPLPLAACSFDTLKIECLSE